MRRHNRRLFVFGTLMVVALIAPPLSAQQQRVFVAYSMKAAQRDAEAAIGAGEDLRKKRADLFYLGGITKPWAVLVDANKRDWILIGEHDPELAVLTLDDWVVALRARYIHAAQDPGVTIDPRPCPECSKACKEESCFHTIVQDVRFFGGVENTHFGQICYEADWLMKRIGFGLEKLPVEELKSYYVLAEEENKVSGVRQRTVAARFWFYPIVNRVNVVDDVVLLEKFQMGIFTEVRYAEVDGKPISNLDRFAHYASEGFARSFTENYDAAAKVREVLESLRGLTRLAALAKGLSQAESKAPLDFWLATFPVEAVRTPTEVPVLSVGNQEAGHLLSGGVRIAALASRLKSGRADALREVVLQARPDVDALTWRFHTELHDGQLAAVIIPKSDDDATLTAELLQQAMFLHSKRRFDAAIECYSKALQHAPNCAVALTCRGLAYAALRDYRRAVEDHTRAIALSENDPSLYCNRADAYRAKREFSRAMSDYERAVSINPKLVAAIVGMAATYHEQGLWIKALGAIKRASEIDNRAASVYAIRGVVRDAVGEYDAAIADLTKALAIDPSSPTAYFNRGLAYGHKMKYELAVQDFDHAIALDSTFADAYYNRAAACQRVTEDLLGHQLLYKREYVEKTLQELTAKFKQDLKMALELDPDGPVGAKVRRLSK